eukprot:2247982-Rhodomonas_salina.2
MPFPGARISEEKRGVCIVLPAVLVLATGVRTSQTDFRLGVGYVGYNRSRPGCIEAPSSAKSIPVRS